jgi:ring-1,2-phenylacetyl-CoA epoxidase subunit PaaD
MVTAAPDRERILDWLRDIPDPEIPVLSITELGIVRDVVVGDGVTVRLTPTYSGCPATETIEQRVVETLRGHGIDAVRIERVLTPPWTSDWITEAGRRRLHAFGIAPPVTGLPLGERQVACPRCASENTVQVSEFGSTACKSAYRCNACLEPFEYFKCL